MSEQKRLPEIWLTECPRDAIQGMKGLVSTETKIAYYNKLLEVGFNAIDIGSFVSHKAIPQMADTREVLEGLDLSKKQSEFIVIVANLRGAQEACAMPMVDSVGFPFSVSETFQQRNANASIEDSLDVVRSIVEETEKHGKHLIIYLSMAFGNPYNEAYDVDMVMHWMEKLAQVGVRHFMPSDTVGLADERAIEVLYTPVMKEFDQYEVGAHLHTAPYNWRLKLDMAYDLGVRRFDCAILGYGGCPMAKDELIGNMPTEQFINYFGTRVLSKSFSIEKFASAMRGAKSIFG